MRPVIEGLIAHCSTAQTNRSNGRVLGLAKDARLAIGTRDTAVAVATTGLATAAGPRQDTCTVGTYSSWHGWLAGWLDDCDDQTEASTFG
jgi:hypothetical protein